MALPRKRVEFDAERSPPAVRPKLVPEAFQLQAERAAGEAREEGWVRLRRPGTPESPLDLPQSAITPITELARREAAPSLVIPVASIPPPLPRKKGAAERIHQTMLAMKAIRLRNDESVIIEAMLLQRPWYQRAASAMFDFVAAVGAVAFDEIRSSWRFMRSPGRGLSHVRTNHTAKRRRSMALLASCGFGLAAIGWIMVSEQEPQVQPLPPVVALHEAPQPALPEASPAVAPLQVATTPKLEPKSALSKLTAPDPQLSGNSKIIAVRSVLLAAPNPRAMKVASLPPNTTLLIYPEIAAPSGWVLARRPNGEVGFLSALHLAGQRDPALDGPAPTPVARPHLTQASARTAVASRPAAQPRSARGHESLTADDLLALGQRRRR